MTVEKKISTIFEPGLTGGTGLGSSHVASHSCSDNPKSTIFELDLTAGTELVPLQFDVLKLQRTQLCASSEIRLKDG